MIELYTWSTPNGQKISVMLEEIGLPYEVTSVDINNGDQDKPEFVAINPNRKIPAIVDTEAPGGRHSVFESGAILIYLAEKTGKLLPKEEPARSEVMQWLMYQMSHVGPIIGQAGHFVNQAEEKIPYAIGRFVGEALRIVGVLNTGLEGRDYLAGEYSIADIATYPWVAAAWEPLTTLDAKKAAELANVGSWMKRLADRPAVQRGMKIPAPA